MAQLTLECPHCRAEKIGFSPRGLAELRPGFPASLLFLQCQGCGQGIIAVVSSTPDPINYWINDQAPFSGGIVDTYPKLVGMKAPADVPGTVQAAFLSGLDNLGRKGGANAAVAMFRRAIELSARAIDKDAPKGINLKERIERLPESVATPAMKKWAQHVRLEANDAVHEPEEYSEADAKELHVFAEMFLTYAFTLPAMLKRATEPIPPAKGAGKRV